MPRSSRPSSTLASAVRQGKRPNSWKTIARSGAGPSTRRPSMRTSPASAGWSPSTTLRNVLLPQPEGPTRLTNCPRATRRSKSASAATGARLADRNVTLTPSAAMNGEPRMSGAASGSSGRTLDGALLTADVGVVARQHASVDHAHLAVHDRAQAILDRLGELIGMGDRADALGALSDGHHREVHVGIADALADPLVLDGPAARDRHALLIRLVVVEGAVVANDEQARDAVVRRGPQRGDAHQVIAVAAQRDGHASGAAQRERFPVHGRQPAAPNARAPRQMDIERA